MTRRYSRRRVLRAGAGVGIGLAGAMLFGCSGDDGASPPDAPAAGTALRVRSVLPAADAGTGRGVLRLGATTEDVGADELHGVSRLLTYSRLVNFDPRASAIYGGVASEVELPEPLVVRFHVRDGQFFHPDGRGVANPLTAFEVAREFGRRRDEGVFVFTDVIERAEATDDTTLMVHLRAPFSLLFEFLAQESASIRDDGEYSAVGAALGSGPFVPSHWEAESLVMTPSPLLTGAAAPRLSSVRVLRTPSASELDLAFSQGELDVRHHVTPASRNTASVVEERTEYARPRHRMRGLALSLLAPRDPASQRTIEAFRDTRVRQALSIALDRGALADLDGAQISGPVGPAFAGDALPEVELSAHSLYQHHADGARVLLAAAGYEGLPVRVSHGETQQMSLLAALVVAQLNEAGFAARLMPRALPDFQIAFLSGDFEAAVFELDRLTTPDLGLRLHTTTGLDGRSPWGYSNPVYDAAVRETLSEIDPVRRTRRSREVQRGLLDAVPAMFPLNAPMEHASVVPGVRGYEFAAYDFNAAGLAAHWEGPSTDG